MLTAKNIDTLHPGKNIDRYVKSLFGKNGYYRTTL